MSGLSAFVAINFSGRGTNSGAVRIHRLAFELVPPNMKKWILLTGAIDLPCSQDQ